MRCAGTAYHIEVECFRSCEHDVHAVGPLRIDFADNLPLDSYTLHPPHNRIPPPLPAETHVGHLHKREEDIKRVENFAEVVVDHQP